MDVPLELVGAIGTTVATVVAVLGGSWAMLRASEKRVDARFDKVEYELSELRNDMTDVKIAIARLEGPRQGLVLGGSR